MTGFLVDAGFYGHPKCVALRKARRHRALSLWLLSGAWCVRNGSPGIVSDAALREMHAYAADVEELTRVGLWEPVDNGAWRFHDWADWTGLLTSSQKLLTSNPELLTSNIQAPQASDLRKRLAPARARGTATTTTKTTTSAACGVGARTEDVSDFGAGEIVGGWLESVDQRPPARVVGQVGRFVREMLAEGIDRQLVERGLSVWADRGLHPSALPSVVHEQQTRPRRKSTTDRRFADNLAMVEEFARREGLEP